MKIAYNADDLAYLAGADPSRTHEVLEQLASGRERVLQPVPPPVGSDEPPRFEIFHDVMAPAVLDWRQRYVAEREREASERQSVAREAALVREKQEAEDRHQETRERLRRSRILSGALALLLIVTGLSLGWAVLSKTEALRSEAEAQRSEVKAQQEALLARYGELLSTDPARSLSTALDVWRADKTDPRAETAVRLSLDADTEQLRLPADSRLAWTSEFSPDGKAVLTAGADGVAKMFDATTGRPLHSFQLSGSEVRPELLAASFSPDGRLVLTVTSTGDVRLFDAATAEDLGLLTHAGPAVHAVWSMLGDHPVVLVSDWNSPPKLWDAGSRKVIATYSKSNAGDAAFSPDGRFVVTVDSAYNASKNASTSQMSVWDVAGRLLQRSQVVGAYADFPRFVGTDSRRICTLRGEDRVE
jgi:hypothetical protein